MWSRPNVEGGILWKKLMHNSNKRGVEGGFLFCGGGNFSKSVSMGSTFIREMRVSKNDDEERCFLKQFGFSYILTYRIREM